MREGGLRDEEEVTRAHRTESHELRTKTMITAETCSVVIIIIIMVIKIIVSITYYYFNYIIQGDDYFIGVHLFSRLILRIKSW